MSEEETTITPASSQEPDPNTVLCRIVDINVAIQSSFQRFLESETKTLEDLANLMREEMSKVELFAPAIDTPQQ